MFAQIAELEALAAKGQVVFATYSAVVDTWRTRYKSVPNITLGSAINESALSCP